MKEFVLLFRMDITTKEVQPSNEQMEIYMKLWMDWIHKIMSMGKLADGGNHFSKTGRVLKPNDEIVDSPYIEDHKSVAGYVIIYSESLDDAEKIAKNCPILTGHNTSVEIRETAIPG